MGARRRRQAADVVEVDEWLADFNAWQRCKSVKLRFHPVGRLVDPPQPGETGAEAWARFVAAFDAAGASLPLCGGGYVTRPHEMFVRAYEAFRAGVSDRATQRSEPQPKS